MKNIYYTTGDFAKLCNTTKNTLFLYDKKGILKPKIVGENGYRYYTREQCVIFYTIKGLQAMGASISDVKKRLNSDNSNDLYQFLEEKSVAFEKQRIKLLQLQNHIDNILRSAPDFYNRTNKLYINHLSMEYIMTYPNEDEVSNVNRYFFSWSNIRKHQDYLITKGYGLPGIIASNCAVNYKKFCKNDFYASYYWNQINFESTDPGFKIKPAGTYAFMYFYGPYDKISENLRKFKGILESQGYNYTGDCYLSYVMFSLFLKSEEKHSYSLSIKIKQQ